MFLAIPLPVLSLMCVVWRNSKPVCINWQGPDDTLEQINGGKFARLGKGVDCAMSCLSDLDISVHGEDYFPLDVPGYVSLL